MNGKDLEKALLWEAPHIGEKAPEQIPEAQNFCEGYKTFLNEGKTERECVKKAVSLLTNAGYKEFDPKAFDVITFTWSTIFWLFVAFLCMIILHQPV